MTFAPETCRTRANRAPRPDEAPVTSATLSSSRHRAPAQDPVSSVLLGSSALRMELRRDVSCDATLSRMGQRLCGRLGAARPGLDRYHEESFASSRNSEDKTDWLSGALGPRTLLFGIGDLTLLGLVARVGTGTGFTIAQLSLLVNASIGIWAFHVPKPGTPQARKVLAGILIAGAGGCVIGAMR